MLFNCGILNENTREKSLPTTYLLSKINVLLSEKLSLVKVFCFSNVYTIPIKSFNLCPFIRDIAKCSIVIKFYIHKKIKCLIFTYLRIFILVPFNYMRGSSYLPAPLHIIMLTIILTKIASFSSPYPDLIFYPFHCMHPVVKRIYKISTIVGFKPWTSQSQSY